MSVALAFVSASWMQLCGLREPVWVVVSALGVASAGSAVILVRRRGRQGPWIRGPMLPGGHGRFILLVTVASAGLWAVAIQLSTPGWSAVVPNSDGNSHGILLTRILVTGSVDPIDVNVSDLTGGLGTGAFYPLGLHVLAAPVAELTSVASALIVPLTMMSSAWAALGAAALTRRFAPGRAAACAAVASVLLVPLFTFGQTAMGLVPATFALALVPAAALAVLDTRSGRGVTLPVLALSGLFAIHVTEALVVGTLVLGAIVFAHSTLSERVRRGGWVLVVVALSAILMWPFLVGLLNLASRLGPGSGSRAHEASAQYSIATSLGLALLHPTLLQAGDPSLFALSGVVAVVVIVVAGIGAARIWRRPVGRSTAIVTVLAVVAAAAAYASNLGVMASPWYGSGDRFASQASVLLPCLVGPGLAVLLTYVESRGGRAARNRGLVLFSAAAVVMAWQCLTVGRAAFSNFSVVTANDRAAFGWLASHVLPGERVLNDRRDGSPWSYDATRGEVAVVFGQKLWFEHETSVNPEVDGRLYLRERIAAIATDPRARLEARRWSVRYVLVGERAFTGAPRLIDGGALAHAAGLRLVFSSGNACVFEIAVS